MKKHLSLLVPLLALMLAYGSRLGATPTEVVVNEAITQSFSKIYYPLPANAVDLGTGVAWATSNYDGAESSKFAPDNTVKGPWYKPSDIVCPTDWRIPTVADCDLLLSNTYSRNATTKQVTIQSRISEESIAFMGSGYREGWSGKNNNNQYDPYYANNPTGTNTWGSSYVDYPYMYLSDIGSDGTITMLIYSGDYSDLRYGHLGTALTHHFTTRLVYDPTSFKHYVVTVHIGNYTQKIHCQEGQEITLVATPQEGHTFQQWGADPTDNNTHKTITVTADAEYYAIFNDGTVKYALSATGTNGHVELSPAGMSEGFGIYASGTQVSMQAVANGGFAFTRWSDGNTTNPRVVNVIDNAEYTAEFAFESQPVSVNVYQETTTDVKKIVYNLSPKTGKDGIEYRPVDMGMGIAWANKNVGASDSTVVGTYFYWGDIEGHTSFGSLYIDTRPAELPTGLDAAYNKIGESWRMPSKEDWLTLKNNATLQNGGTFVSNVDNSKKIFLPISGAYAYKYTKSSQRCYMSRTYRSNDIEYVFRDVNGSYDVQSNLGSNNDLDIACGLPVRAIYNPQYTVRTLTVHVGDYDYIYYCQHGQNVTVTAIANTAANQVFKWWKDNQNTDATRVFTMTADLEVEAVFQFNPSIPHGTATFKDWDNTQLAQVEVAAGSEPVYSGATPTRVGYTFTGWSPAITAMTDGGNVIYTATYSRESADAFVDVYQNVSSNSTKILYYLPEEKEFNDGNKYSAIDMGYGVAWSDRNVGATSVNAIGSYFRWGDPIASNYNLKKDAQNWSSLSGGQNFAEEYDMAKGVLGSNWHVPSNTEYQRLLDNTTISNNNPLAELI